MNNTTTANQQGFDYNVNNSRSSNSAVSWGAIVAGAAAGASLSLILLILGVGLGLSSISPWANEGISAGSFGISTIIWLTITQLLSSALGGYLAGRLRTKWVDVQSDEVYFRDTAHGFLSWAIASLATAALLASFVGAVIGGSASVVSGIGHTATMAAMADMEQPVSDMYKRVQSEIQSTAVSKREAAEAAREASAYAALWIFIALLIGAFSSSLAATFGGKQRDGISTQDSIL